LSRIVHDYKNCTGFEENIIKYFSGYLEQILEFGKIEYILGFRYIIKLGKFYDSLNFCENYIEIEIIDKSHRFKSNNKRFEITF